MKNNPDKVVTTYRFSGLLRQAWKKTMTPATIMAGFRRCGVYPLRLDAIDCSISVESFGGVSSEDSQDEDGENDKENTEQHQLFQTRFEEGARPRLFDWNHPESLPEEPLPDNDKIPWYW